MDSHLCAWDKQAHGVSNVLSGLFGGLQNYMVRRTRCQLHNSARQFMK